MELPAVESCCLLSIHKMLYNQAMPRGRRGATERAPDGRRIYSLGDVGRYADVPRPQAQDRLKHRVIVPDYESSGGPGQYHGFTFRNLVEFAVAKRLSEFGATIDVMKDAMQELRMDSDDRDSAMPRMRRAIASVPKRKRPTKKKAVAWIDEQVRKGGVGSGDLQIPKRVADFNRNAAASGPVRRRLLRTIACGLRRLRASSLSGDV